VCVGGTLWSPVCVVWFGAGIMLCLVYHTANCSVNYLYSCGEADEIALNILLLNKQV